MAGSLLRVGATAIARTNSVSNAGSFELSNRSESRISARRAGTKVAPDGVRCGGRNPGRASSTDPPAPEGRIEATSQVHAIALGREPVLEELPAPDERIEP